MDQRDGFYLWSVIIVEYVLWPDYLLVTLFLVILFPQLLLGATVLQGLRAGSTPCCHIDRARVVLIGQTDEQLAAWRVIVLANRADATIHTTHDKTIVKVFCTRPIAYLLTAILLLQGHMLFLSRALHQVRYVTAISLNHTSQILHPIHRIGVAVPAHRRNQRLNLKQVGIGQQPHHRPSPSTPYHRAPHRPAQYLCKPPVGVSVHLWLTNLP